MAALLSRLGIFAARNPWTVIATWCLLLAVTISTFLSLGGALRNSFDVPGTASGEVVDQLAEELPETAGGTGVVVFRTVDGSAFTAPQREAVSALSESAEHLDGVEAVVDPFSTTGDRDEQRAELDAAVVQFDQALNQDGLPPEQVAELEDAAAQAALALELLDHAEGIGVLSEDESTATVNISYSASRLDLSDEVKEATVEHFEETEIVGVTVDFSAEISQGGVELFGKAEMIGLGIAAVVLIVVLGSLVAAMLPLVTALMGVAIGVSLSLSFSGAVDMASVTPVLGVMLGLAVGIDYALFIVNRHRKQLLGGASVTDSVGLATGTSGTAVVFAGTTVVIALLAL
ncbi:MAG: MMPL family transporter, partial [Pseudoclavibacter sp.]